MNKFLLYFLAIFMTAAFAAEFKVGFHIDLRIQQKSAEQLKAQLTSLSEMGYNTVIIEWEATFPFKKHPGIQNAYAYTQAEIKDIHSHAQKCKIDLISQQQTLGHLEYVLMNDRYERVREDRYNLSQICPQRKDSLVLIKDLLKEMCDATTSKYLHIGGDEARLLGHCKSCSKYCRDKSIEELFGNYTTKVCEYVIELGKIPVIWADMVLQHPECIDHLPQNTILVDWNYGWDLNRFGPLQDILKNKKITFWGAAAIRSAPDNYFLTNWERHLKNIHDYSEFAHENFGGLFLTSWATSGVYDYAREPSNHVIEIIPLRRTFPDASMEFLKSIFAKVASGKNHDENIIYTELQQYFGISKVQATSLWKNLSENQKSIKGKNIEEKLKQAEKYLEIAENQHKTLKDIKAQTNQIAYQQVVLHQQMRVHYLKQRRIGFLIEMSGLDNDVSTEIFKLHQESQLVDQNYQSLFKDHYLLDALKDDCEARSKNLNSLVKLTKAAE